jgi:hypothetical protein
MKAEGIGKRISGVFGKILPVGVRTARKKMPVGGQGRETKCESGKRGAVSKQKKNEKEDR